MSPPNGRPRAAARRVPVPRGASPDRRIRLLLLLAGVLLTVVLGRAVQLQAFEGRALAARALAQHRQTVTLPASRGAIRDREGHGLAVTQEAVTIGARLDAVRDAPRLAARVAAITGAEPDDLLERLSTPEVLHVDLVRQVDPAVADRLRGRPEFAALTYTPEDRRVYASPVAAQLIGVTNLESTGIAGLEQRYERELAGRDGREIYVRDPAGDQISVVSSTPARQGSDLELTIDRDLQSAAEAEVSRVTNRYRADGAVAVMLDVRTGGVLAMVSTPRPGKGGYRAAGEDERRIRAITDQYEPGSTFKVTTVAAGLAERVITPSTTIEVPHCMIRYDRRICDHHPHPTETMSVERILAESSNIGTVKIADEYLSGAGEADHGQFYAPWIERLGFGVPTGIDLPGEASGTVLPYADWSGVSVTNIPIGQGIAVTPIQLAALYGMLASDGVWRRPHLVARVGQGRRVAVPTRRMLPRRVARQVNRMLEGVVSDEGTGKLAAVPGYTVAGKTGTTQKLDDDGTYSRTRHIAFFVGFAPARDPRVVTLVLVDEPKGDDDYGGTVAAPVFAELTGRALRELRVPRR